MSEDYQRIEVIKGAARRRHWSTEQKLASLTFDHFGMFGVPQHEHKKRYSY